MLNFPLVNSRLTLKNSLQSYFFYKYVQNICLKNSVLAHNYNII